MRADAGAGYAVAPLAISPAAGDAALHVVAAFTLLALAILSFVIATPFGVVASLVLTVALCAALPAGIPAAIVTAFLYQNMVIAFVGPLVPSNDAFDALRGTNFVLLMAAFGAFVFAAFLSPCRLPAAARTWLLATLVVVAVVVVYLALGAVRGDPRDAVVYFRNTVTPLACFAVALLAAAQYAVDLRRALVVLGAGALVFGYCELFFTVDFLSLFNGDDYIQRRMIRQIETGYWERILDQTGFVLRGLEDVMMVPLFNVPGLKDVMPTVFRLSGPNFHPISFAYALAIIAVWLMFQGRFVFIALALPLLLVVGSKGALVLVSMSVFMMLAVRIVPARAAIPAFFAVMGSYLAAAIVYGRSVGDYHVLGLLAGLRDFLRNPIGQGLGFGGNLSGSIEGNLDWSRSQLEGIADVPVESAVGVMLYQMGVGAFVFFGLLAVLIRTCRALYLGTGRPEFLFGLVAVTTISVNAVLQEEAFFSPLALGLCLLLVALALGTHWRTARS